MSKYGKLGALILCLLTSWAITAQNGPGRQKIKTLKVAFITERLSLTPEEAQVFWPVYNEHEQNIQSIRRKERLEVQTRLMDMALLTEAEANQLLDVLVNLEREKQELHISFLKKVSQVITPKKTLLLIKAEEDFKRRLLREMQQRRRGGG